MILLTCKSDHGLSIFLRLTKSVQVPDHGSTQLPTTLDTPLCTPSDRHTVYSPHAASAPSPTPFPPLEHPYLYCSGFSAQLGDLSSCAPAPLNAAQPQLCLRSCLCSPPSLNPHPPATAPCTFTCKALHRKRRTGTDRYQ